MAVRCKFKVDSVETPDAEGNVSTVRLSPVYDGCEENKQFFRWTPSGSISFGTVNAAAAKQFEAGKEFYVDFTPAGE
jgi:hypothetical protein